MNLLLDTHAWLWFHLGDPRLSQNAKQHILDPANTKLISPASFWEISIKISLTFAPPAKSKDFSAGFPRSSLGSAGREVQSGVVETYPLEGPMAKLR